MNKFIKKESSQEGIEELIDSPGGSKVQALRKNPVEPRGRLGAGRPRCRFPTSVFVSARERYWTRSISAPGKANLFVLSAPQARAKQRCCASLRGLSVRTKAKSYSRASRFPGRPATAQSSFRIIRKRYCPGAPCAATWRLAWKRGMSPPQSRTPLSTDCSPGWV